MGYVEELFLQNLLLWSRCKSLPDNNELFLQVRVVSARYIMKCDDDTFVRLESVMAEVKKIRNGESLYIGNMNYHHKPLRDGKWAVTYEVSLIFDSSMISCGLFPFIDLRCHLTILL